MEKLFYIDSYIKNFTAEIKEIKEEEAKELGLYNTVGKEIDDRYIEELKKKRVPDATKHIDTLYWSSLIIIIIN